MENYTSADGTMFSLPILVNVTTSGKKQYWKGFVTDNQIHRHSWLEGGKVREFPILSIKGKNIGRSNETSDHQQALNECLRKWLDQQAKGYVVKTEDGDEGVRDCGSTQSLCTTALLLPMLAQKFTEREKHVKFPCGVSRKLDGIRMISCFNEGKIVLTSRTGKPFMHVEKIRQHILEINNEFGTDLVLDGELYSHDLPFSVISGAIRSTKQKSSSDDLLEYWIFDIVDVKKPYKERALVLDKIQHWYEDRYAKGERVLKFELYELVHHKTDIKAYHDKYVADGFEGLIIRNLDGLYSLKHRSNDLQKFKSFDDAEFEIVGFKLGTGVEEGAIIYECKWGEGKTFDVRPRGSIPDRIEKAKDGDTFIGKMLTVRYQPSVKQSDVDKNELPRFPIGIVVRDYE